MMESGIPFGERPKEHAEIMGTNQQPWLPTGAINFLEEKLSHKSIGFEFGAGSSTFWFSKLTKKIYSLESDTNWYTSIVNLVNDNKIENIDINCIACSMHPVWELDTEISDSHVEYANHILGFNFSFDYIVVDGVARSLCIKNSISKIKPNGFLVIDNAERPGYHDAISEIPKSWILFEFENEIDLALIYQRKD